MLAIIRKVLTPVLDFTQTLNDLEYSLVTDFPLSIISLNDTQSIADIANVYADSYTYFSNNN